MRRLRRTIRKRKNKVFEKDFADCGEVLFWLDDNAVAVVHFMLDDLCGPAGERSPLQLPIHVTELHFDFLVPGGFADAGEGKASLFRLEGFLCREDFRVEHDHIHDAHAHNDDVLPDANHVGRHAHAPVAVRPQSVHQIPANRHIFFRCRLRLLSQEKGIFHNFSYHLSSYISTISTSHPFSRRSVTRSSPCSQTVAVFSFG